MKNIKIKVLFLDKYDAEGDAGVIIDCSGEKEIITKEDIINSLVALAIEPGQIKSLQINGGTFADGAYQGREKLGKKFSCGKFIRRQTKDYDPAYFSELEYCKVVGVKEVSAQMFANTPLKSFIADGRLEKISEQAFYNCRKIDSSLVSIPDTTIVAEDAFENSDVGLSNKYFLRANNIREDERLF